MESRGSELPGKEPQSLEDLLFGIHAGRWALNMQSGEVHCSEKWAEIIGYKLEEVSPGTLETWENLLHPDDLDKMSDAMQAFGTGKADVHTLEIRVKHKLGHYVHVLAGGQVVSHTDDGKPEWVQGIHQDITTRKLTETERKKAEEHFKQLSNEYERVFEGTQSAMFLVEVCDDGLFRYVRTNEAYKKMSGYSDADTHGKTPHDLFVDDAADEIIANYKKCIDAGKTIEYELEIMHRGKRHVVYAELNPINENGITKYIVGSSTDITEQRKILDELLVAKEKAEAGDRLKTAFLNNISHEIRTPLNGILGFGQLLGQKGLTPKQHQSYLESMKKSSQRLIDTIDKIVDISLILSDTLEVHKEEISPSYLLKEVYETMWAQCQEKGLYMTLDIPDTMENIKIEADRLLLLKAMLHIIDNAIKFTEKGSITIGLKTEGDRLCMFVKDTGIGIESGFLDKIFEPFSQEDVAITRGYEGSGLGLSIASGIVKKLDAEMHVQSGKSTGSNFVICFRMKQDEQNDAQARAGQADDSVSAIGSDENASVTPPLPVILIADDDDMAIFLLETLLEELDVKLIAARNGKEAVEAFRANPDICAVVMDVKMPLMDGLEATQQIKSIRSDVPVIAVTAHAASGDEHRIRAAGCDDYISKPLNGLALIETIEAHAPCLKKAVKK